MIPDPHIDANIVTRNEEQEENARRDIAERDKKRLSVERWTLGVAVAALIAAFCAYWQTSRQADAAQHQLGIMRKQFQTDERAWLTEEHFNLETNSYPLITNVQIIVARMNFFNTGKTPALKLKTAFIITTNNDRTMFDFREWKDVTNSVGSVGGGREFHCVAMMSAQRQIDWLSGITTFARGRVEYDDICGGHHWRRFSIRIDPAVGFHNVSEFGNASDDSDADETGQKKDDKSAP